MDGIAETAWLEKPVVTQPIPKASDQGEPNQEEVGDILSPKARAEAFFRQLDQYRRGEGSVYVAKSSPKLAELQESFSHPQEKNDEFVIEGEVEDVSEVDEEHIEQFAQILAKSFQMWRTDGFWVRIAPSSKETDNNRNRLKVEFVFFKPWYEQKADVRFDPKNGRTTLSVRKVNGKIKVSIPSKGYQNTQGKWIQRSFTHDQDELFRLIPERDRSDSWRVETALGKVPEEIAIQQPNSQFLDASQGSFTVFPGTTFWLPSRGIKVEFDVRAVKSESNSTGIKEKIKNLLAKTVRRESVPSPVDITMQFSRYQPVNEKPLSNYIPDKKML